MKKQEAVDKLMKFFEENPYEHNFEYFIKLIDFLEEWPDGVAMLPPLSSKGRNEWTQD